MSHNSLLNKVHTRKFILDNVKQMRKGWDCKQISGEYIEMLEYHLRTKILSDIKRHPTKGKTFKN